MEPDTLAEEKKARHEVPVNGTERDDKSKYVEDR
ncbi:hypothetical protein PI125_g19571 [Phytophthora idaei]|nr:hypothetical protein PI125_g19571 [Phytophthora idaei]